MNCEQAGDKLIDLAYGELEATEAHRAEEHLRTCPPCRKEFEQLQLARTALRRFRLDEPAAEGIRTWARRMIEQKSPAAPRRARLHIRRILGPLAGVAAAAVIVITVWLVQEKTASPIFGETGPVEIERLSVSLTILSEPEKRPGYRYPGWTGMALVRDQRLIRRLKRGITEVRFTGVPSGIVPDSVRLRSLDAPDGLTILEQNYQYDLASGSAVLKRYIDKPITAAFKDGETTDGALLSFDDKTLVIRPGGEGPRNVSREHLKAISFEKLPEGLLTAPTLVWRLRNNAGTRQQFEVAYLTGGLTWRADYILKLRQAERPAANNHAEESETLPPGEQVRNPQSEIRNPKSEIFDSADLVGYATVTNNSGVTFEDAQLKLLAGDVNLIRREMRIDNERSLSEWWGREGLDGRSQFQEKSFFEYHLYTLSRPTTLRSAETKQIELVSGNGIKLKRGYVYDPTVNRTAARVVSEMKNSEKNGLGRPLPKGVIRLYAPDPEGVDTYVAQTTIDHTPKDETIRLPWGYAFDIACSYTQTEHRRSGSDHHEKCEYNLRNHKDYDVNITVIARMNKSTYQAVCNYPWSVREVGIVEICIPVKANSTATVKFSHSYNPRSGGGLKSPYDEEP